MVFLIVTLWNGTDRATERTGSSSSISNAHVEQINITKT